MRTNRASYTVIASPTASVETLRFAEKISVILLNRGSWIFRPEVLEELEALGFSEIISVEEPPYKLDFEELVGRYRNVRFLLLNRPCTAGEKINLAADEVTAGSFLVLWDDQKIPEAGLHTKVAKLLSDETGVCLLPEFRNKANDEIPSCQTPSLHRSKLRILTLPAEAEVCATLFPFDYSGYYDRRKFILTGGFDSRLTNAFWQKADWGMRCHLWGESLYLNKTFRMEYRSETPIEDRNHDESYKRFFLKNLAIRFTGDQGVLPRSRFWSYWLHSGQTLPGAWAEFVSVRSWVLENRYRFKTEARFLVELWGARR